MKFKCKVYETDGEAWVDSGVLNFSPEVKVIPPHMFQNREDIYRVVLPPHLEIIGECAFYGCNKLKYVNFDECKYLEVIDTSAFNSCGLLEVIMPDSIINVGRSAFYSNSSLSKIRISKSLKIIPANCFRTCICESIEIPPSVEIIDNNAFFCSDIKKIKIPSSVKIIGDGALFSGHTNTIDASAFKGISLGFIGQDCIKYLLNSKAYYHNHPYKRNKLLKKLYSGHKVLTEKDYFIDQDDFLHIDEGVEVIPSGAFNNRYLRGVEFPSTLKIIEDKAFFHSDFRKVTFPESLIYIGESSFEKCDELCSVEFNNGLQIIDDYAFAGTYISDISLPSSVIYLGTNALNSKAQTCKVSYVPEHASVIRTSNNYLDSNSFSSYPKECVIMSDDYNYLLRFQKTPVDDYDEDILAKHSLTKIANNCNNVSLHESNILAVTFTKYLDCLSYDQEVFNTAADFFINSGANVDYVDLDGNPLLFIMYYRNLTRNAVITLIRKGANINARNNEGDTLLSLVTCRGDKEMINILVELGCNLNTLNNKGLSPLMYAAHNGDMSTVNYLIKHGALVNLKNRDGKTVIDIIANYDSALCDYLKGIEEVPTTNFLENTSVEEDLKSLERLLRK